MLTNSSFPNSWTKNLGASTHRLAGNRRRTICQLRPAILSDRSREHDRAKTNLFDEVNTYLASARILKPRPDAELPCP